MKARPATPKPAAVPGAADRRSSPRPAAPWRALAGAALLLLLPLLVFAPALSGAFIWDDTVLVSENAEVRSPDGLKDIWASTKPVDYLPVMLTAFWAQWRLWQDNTTGYHVVNVLLHGLNALLVWRVLRRLRLPAAWLAALDFAVHPVNVETAATIAQLKNTLAFFFFGLSLLCYLRSEPDPGPHPPAPDHRPWKVGGMAYGLALLCFTLGLLSKSAVVMLPVVLLGFAWWQRGSIRWHDLVRTAPFFLLSLACAVVTVWFQQHRAIQGESVNTEPLLTRLAIAGCAPWFYLWKLVLPADLSFVYPRWEFAPGAPGPLLPGLGLLVVLAACWRWRDTWGRPVLFGLGYFVVTLFPVMGFFSIFFHKFSFVADRWQYFSNPGIIALAVCGLAGLVSRLDAPARGRWQTAGLGLAVLAAGAMSWQSWRLAAIYKNEETLWRYTIARNPKAWLAHDNLVDNLVQRAADQLFALPEEERPRAAQTLPALVEAITRGETILQQNPNLPVMHYHLGNAMQLKPGQQKAAIAHYEKAVALQPRFVQARSSLARLLLEHGQTDRALVQLREIVRLAPDWVENVNTLAWLLATDSRSVRRDGAEAVRLAEDAAARDRRRDPRILDSLAAAYAETGRFEQAAATAREALAKATALQHRPLMEGLERRLKLYEKERPYREEHP